MECAGRAGYAGIVSRLTGLAVDAALLTLAGLAVGTLPSLAWEQVIGRSPGWLATASGVASALLPWAYFTGCWWLTGRTLGALIVGVEVQVARGGHLSGLRAVTRAAVGLLLAPVWLLGMIGVLIDGRRRALHDLLFGTVVRFTGRQSH